jgi:hypothetical protein
MSHEFDFDVSNKRLKEHEKDGIIVKVPYDSLKIPINLV